MVVKTRKRCIALLYQLKANERRQIADYAAGSVTAYELCRRKVKRINENKLTIVKGTFVKAFELNQL